MLTEEERFTPEDLIELVKSLGKKLAMVIDLTNTTKYYNKDKLEDISYIKIFTPGRVVPSPEIVSQFFLAVDSIEDKLEKDDVIAVHCTHGVNRTGYFICKYMVDKLKLSPEVAIDKFNTARGHNIERELYLENLKGVDNSKLQMERPNKHRRWSYDNDNQFVQLPAHKRRINSSNDEHYDHSNPKYPFSAQNGHPYDKHYDRGPNQYRPGDLSYSAQDRQAYNEHYDNQRPTHYRHKNSSLSWRNAPPPPRDGYYDRAYDYNKKNGPGKMGPHRYWSHSYKDYEYKSPVNHVSSDFESQGPLNHRRQSNRVSGYTNRQFPYQHYKKPKESWRNDGHW